MNHIWERMEGEPHRWFQRFTIYKMAGPGRTIEATWRADTQQSTPKGQRPARQWYERAKEFKWVLRAQAWDEFQQQQEEALWRSRKREQREREWVFAEQLMEKASQVLRLPITRQHTTKTVMGPDGSVVEQHITIEPARVTIGDAARLAKAAADLARASAAANLAEALSGIDWRAAANEDGIDPEKVKGQLVEQFLTAMAGNGGRGSLQRGIGPPSGDDAATNESVDPAQPH